MDTDKAIYTEGKALLGRNAGAYLTLKRREINDDTALIGFIRAAARKTEGRDAKARCQDAKEYIGGCIRDHLKAKEIDFEELHRLADAI